MPSAAKWLRALLPLLLLSLFAGALWIHGSARFDQGYAKAKAEGDKALAELRLEHVELRAEAAEQNLDLYIKQVARAHQAEQLLLRAQAELKTTKQQLQERTAHVSNQYRPAPAAAPVATPRCVFTRGWVRDFNLALGAGLPAAGTGATATSAAAAAWPAAGADAELLESGVSPADVLAYAQDYGEWAQSNLAQLNKLLDLQEKESR